jgi:DNA-binding beta-propeller fold protein YncE
MVRCVWKFWYWLLMACFAFMMAGCATKLGTFNFGIPPSLEVNRPMWPSPKNGEVPRYMYAGQLTGEGNFREPEMEPYTKARSFANWLLGLFDTEAPVVLQRPQSGVVDDSGRIYVTDISRQAVYVFDPHENRLDVWEQIGNRVHFVSPTGIALGENGDIFVADSDLGIVVRLNRKGESLGAIGQGELRRPVGVAYDAITHLLYVVDTYGHDIKVYGKDGRLQRTLGHRGDKPGEFNYPTYIVLDRGNLYVSDTMNARVQVLDAETGQSKLVIGELGINVGNLVRPKGVAVDSEGDVYVVESYFDRLLVYNKNGQFLMPIGTEGRMIGEFYLPSGVWIDAHNQVYVADMMNGRVMLFQFLGGDTE